MGRFRPVRCHGMAEKSYFAVSLSNSIEIEETTSKREESPRQLIAHCNGLKECLEKEGKAF